MQDYGLTKNDQGLIFVTINITIMNFREMIGRGDERWVELANKVLRFTVDVGQQKKKKKQTEKVLKYSAWIRGD